MLLYKILQSRIENTMTKVNRITPEELYAREGRRSWRTNAPLKLIQLEMYRIWNRHVQTWSGDICNSQWGQSMESNFNSHIPKNSTNMNFNICFCFHNNKMEKVKLDAFFQWVEFCCHLLHWQNFYQKSWKIMKIWNSWRIMKVFIWFLQSIKILWAD